MYSFHPSCAHCFPPSVLTNSPTIGLSLAASRCLRELSTDIRTVSCCAGARHGAKPERRRIAKSLEGDMYSFLKRIGVKPAERNPVGDDRPGVLIGESERYPERAMRRDVVQD